MGLPKVAVPSFELKQPSTGKILKYRPFLVKEEKILLMAKESGENVDVFNAVKQIVSNCILDEEFDIENVPLFDVEYIFIQLRSKSVDNIVKFQVEDSDDKKIYDLKLDLNEVEVQMPEDQHDGIVKVNDSVGVKLLFPSSKVIDDVKDATSVEELTQQMVMHSIEYVFDNENTYPWDKETKEEKQSFVDSLPIDAYERIQDFFEKSPKIEHIVTYKNSEGKEKKVVFRNLDDFFMLY